MSGQLVTNLLLKTGADGRLNLEVDQKSVGSGSGCANGGGSYIAPAASSSSGGGGSNLTQDKQHVNETLQCFLQPGARVQGVYVQPKHQFHIPTSGAWSISSACFQVNFHCFCRCLALSAACESQEYGPAHFFGDCEQEPACGVLARWTPQ